MRILLVDDEIRLVDGLRRTLRLERPSWQVKTALSGLEALQLLQRESFDVLVTDMQMPGMDGASLLREAQLLAPETVRIILSGHAGQERIQSCEDAYHQYLGKPIDPEHFISLLDDMNESTKRPESLRARRLVAGLPCVPSLPSLYEQLVRVLKEGSPTVKELIELLRFDLGMASKLLKLANCCGKGPGDTPMDLYQALSQLSIDQFEQSVFRYGALAVAPSPAPSGLDLNELWEHSNMVAQVARSIALTEGHDATAVNLCHLSGLFHDLGRVLLASDPALDYRRVMELTEAPNRPLVADLERNFYGTTHAEVGAELLWLWGVDKRVCNLVRHHHQPAVAAPDAEFLSILRFADAWCTGLVLSSPSPYADGSFDLQELRDPRNLQRARILAQHLPLNPWTRWSSSGNALPS